MKLDPVKAILYPWAKIKF